MFDKLKDRLKEKFPPGKHQTCYLYDEIMKHLGVDGIEGEEVARLVMVYLHEQCFLELQPSLFGPDMFETV